MSAPNVGTMAIYQGLPALVVVTHDSWTDALADSDDPTYQPDEDQVVVLVFKPVDVDLYSSYQTVAIADLTYPNFQAQAV
jgi:hypothetical protein